MLDGELWFPELKESGNVIARVITDGPDADFDKPRWTLLAALAEAQTSVKILTPYFLPDSALVTALNLAALRGVRVDIILPAKNNLPSCIGRHARCGGRCSSAAATSGSRRRRSTIPS